MELVWGLTFPMEEREEAPWVIVMVLGVVEVGDSLGTEEGP